MYFALFFPVFISYLWSFHCVLKLFILQDFFFYFIIVIFCSFIIAAFSWRESSFQFLVTRILPLSIFNVSRHETLLKLSFSRDENLFPRFFVLLRLFFSFSWREFVVLCFSRDEKLTIQRENLKFALYFLVTRNATFKFSWREFLFIWICIFHFPYHLTKSIQNKKE